MLNERAAGGTAGDEIHRPAPHRSGADDPDVAAEITVGFTRPVMSNAAAFGRRSSFASTVCRCPIERVHRVVDRGDEDDARAAADGDMGDDQRLRYT